MKTKYLFPVLFIIFAQKIHAQVTFLKMYSDIPVDYMISAGDIKPTSDSGYIFTGFNDQSQPIIFYGPFLMKLDINGDTVWTKHYINSPGGVSVIQTCDGGYATTGGNGIIKTNSTGDTLWTRSYPGMDACRSYITNDCGFIFLGRTNTLGAGEFDVYMIKTDSAGHPLWSKTYGGDSIDQAFSLQQTTDGGFIIAGTSNSFSTGGENNIYVIKTNGNGDTLWTKSYAASASGISGRWIRQTYDHGYIILGGGPKLIKTDSTGNVMWSKSYFGGTGGRSVLQSPDSGYIFTCTTPGGLPWNILFIKTDSNGNILWHNAFGVEDFNYETPLYRAADGGYIIAGTSVINSMWQETYIFVKKTNANGLACFEQFPTVTANADSIISNNTATVVTSPSATVTSPPPFATTNAIVTAGTQCTSVDIEEKKPVPSPVIYPSITSKNGSTDIFINQDLKNAEVTVFNVMGLAIYSDKVSGKGKTLLVTLNGKLSPGMYFIRIIEGEKAIVKKIIVL